MHNYLLDWCMNPLLHVFRIFCGVYPTARQAAQKDIQQMFERELCQVFVKSILISQALVEDHQGACVHLDVFVRSICVYACM